MRVQHNHQQTETMTHRTNPFEEKFRTQLRKLLGITDLENSVLNLLQALNEEKMQTRGWRTRHDNLRREVEELGVLARETKDALGGVYWKTLTGHRRPIALLSDTHLQAIIDGNYARGSVLEAIKAEQARRVEDDRWADRQGPGSLRQRVASLENLVRTQREVGRTQFPDFATKSANMTRRHADIDYDELELRTLWGMLFGFGAKRDG